MSKFFLLVFLFFDFTFVSSAVSYNIILCVL